MLIGSNFGHELPSQNSSSRDSPQTAESKTNLLGSHKSPLLLNEKQGRLDRRVQAFFRFHSSSAHDRRGRRLRRVPRGNIESKEFGSGSFACRCQASRVSSAHSSSKAVHDGCSCRIHRGYRRCCRRRSFRVGISIVQACPAVQGRCNRGSITVSRGRRVHGTVPILWCACRRLSLGTRTSSGNKFAFLEHGGGVG